MKSLLKNKMVNDGISFMVRSLVNAAFIFTGIVVLTIITKIIQ